MQGLVQHACTEVKVGRQISPGVSLSGPLFDGTWEASQSAAEVSKPLSGNHYENVNGHHRCADQLCEWVHHLVN